MFQPTFPPGYATPITMYLMFLLPLASELTPIVTSVVLQLIEVLNLFGVDVG